jgi:pimeloyl-ACP methyl ester carboxylesterase
MPTAAVRGVDLHYERTGDGPQVLFCNGSGATLAGSRPLIGLVARGVDVLAFDQRGLGRSGSCAPGYGMADLAADALALLDHVGWDRCAVVGVSFGGMVAQELAVTAPERVERLALLCTSAGGAGGSSYPLHELADLDPADRARRMVTLVDTRFDDRWLADHPGDRALVDLLTADGPVPTPEEAAGRAAQLEARRHHDAWDRLGRITCPTLVQAGATDGIAPPANAEALAGRIPGAALRVYDGGHAFFVQDRTALPDLHRFLLGHGDVPTGA